eukprot:gene8175-10923_t
MGRAHPVLFDPHSHPGALIAETTAIDPWLLAILVQHTSLEASEITPDALLGADLGLDSLDEAAVAIEVEQVKGIEIDEKLIAADFTVADLVRLID